MSERKTSPSEFANFYKKIALVATYLAVIGVVSVTYESFKLYEQAQEIQALKEADLNIAELAPVRAQALADYLNQNSVSQPYKYLPVFNGTINDKNDPQRVMWFSPIVLNDKQQLSGHQSQEFWFAGLDSSNDGKVEIEAFPFDPNTMVLVPYPSDDKQLVVNQRVKVGPEPDDYSTGHAYAVDNSGQLMINPVLHTSYWPGQGGMK